MHAHAATLPNLTLKGVFGFQGLCSHPKACSRLFPHLSTGSHGVPMHVFMHAQCHWRNRSKSGFSSFKVRSNAGQKIYIRRCYLSQHYLVSTSPLSRARSSSSSMELTPQQLSQYNGSDPSKPIYVALKGRIFDVTTGKSFYGPGGAYAMFAGKDASRALAKMSKNDEDITPSLDGLSEKEIGVLNDWEKKFEAKYPVVGRVAN